MPLFMIERNVAEHLEVQSDDMAAIMRVNANVGVHWVLSFLSADKKKTYCLYEAPSAEAIHEAARQAFSQRVSVLESDPCGLRVPESSRDLPL